MFARLRMSWGHRRSAAVLPPADIGSLDELHAYFIQQVNEAVAEGREDCIPGLVDSYWDETARAIDTRTLGWNDPTH